MANLCNQSREEITGANKAFESRSISLSEVGTSLVDASLAPSEELVKLDSTMDHNRHVPPKQYGLRLNVADANCQDEIPTAPKSPVTIQEWIDSIEISQSKVEDDLLCQSGKDISEADDFLKLGAEAQHLQTGPRHVPSQMDSRMQAMLATLAYDPEEVLLNLGLGDDSNDPLTRIPPRFLKDSKLNGDMLETFLRKQDEHCELVDAGLCGYRGLSGYTRDSPRFSGIVLKCLHRIRDATRNIERTLTPPTLTVSNPACTMSFFRAVYSVLAVNTFRNSVQRDSSSTQSILEPENQAFLDSQSRRRRRQKGKLILEKNSVAIDADEDVFSDDASEYDVEAEPFVSPVNDIESPKITSVWDRLRKAKFDLEVYKDVESKNDGNIAQPSSHNTRKKPNPIQRQRSVDEDRLSDQESLIQPKIKLQKPSALLKCSFDTKADSFELEELPSNVDDDDDIVSSSERSSFIKSAADILRTESAVSDSSGFLDGEALDGTGTINLDELSAGFQPIMESSCAFLEGNQYFSNEDGSMEDSGDIGDNVGLDREFTSNNNNNANELPVTFDKNIESATEDINEVSETHVEAELNKMELPFDPTNLTSSSVSVNDYAKREETQTNLNKGISASALDLSQYKIYLSPFSRYNWLKTSSGSLQNLNENEYRHFHHSNYINISDEHWSSWRDCHRVRRYTGVNTTENAKAFHKSCTSVIENMQYILQLYSRKLKMMERMCWESYHGLFPGTSSAERRELQNLSELRRLILSEARKTKELLNKKADSMKFVKTPPYSSTSCDLQMIDVAMEMQELVREQDQLMLQLKEPVSSNNTTDIGDSTPENNQMCHQTAVEQAVAKGKEELLMDIKKIMKSDNEEFLTQLLATRQEIEGLKSLCTKFLSTTGGNN